MMMFFSWKQKLHFISFPAEFWFFCQKYIVFAMVSSPTTIWDFDQSTNFFLDNWIPSFKFFIFPMFPGGIPCFVSSQNLHTTVSQIYMFHISHYTYPETWVFTLCSPSSAVPLRFSRPVPQFCSDHNALLSMKEIETKIDFNSLFTSQRLWNSFFNYGFKDFVFFFSISMFFLLLVPPRHITSWFF